MPDETGKPHLLHGVSHGGAIIGICQLDGLSYYPEGVISVCTERLCFFVELVSYRLHEGIVDLSIRVRGRELVPAGNSRPKMIQGLSFSTVPANFAKSLLCNTPRADHRLLHP